MAFSMAGLASTMQGYDQADRQRKVDAQTANNAQRDQWKFDQEKTAADEQSRTAAILRGEDTAGLGSATAKVQTNGGGIVDSIKGLFGASPAQPEQQSAPSSAQQPTGLSSVAPAQQAAPALPYYKQAQARLDAYAAKNPNDVNTIQAAQAKIDILAKGDTDRSHATFVKHGENAVQQFIASGGMNTAALDEVTSKHFPDGHTYATARNKDGTYTVTQTDTGQVGQPMTFDQIGQRFSSLLHPDVYMGAHAKAQEAGLIEGAKLPSQIGLKNVESKNKITEQDAKLKGETQQSRETGVVAKNAADVNQSNASAGLSSASAGEKRFDTEQKRAVAKLTEEIIKIDETVEPSRYKELVKKRDLLLSTKPQKDAEPKVVAEGGSVYNQAAGTWENKDEYLARTGKLPPVLPKGTPAAPKGFKPL